MSDLQDTSAEFVLYKRRWLVLIALTLLNLSNNALWISYSAVADITAAYFETTADQVDWLGTISFLVGIPMCVASTYVVDTWGFKTGIYAGSVLTLAGGTVRALSTLQGVWDLDLGSQYYISLFGQALTGMGNPFAVSLPTKVSQNWFGERERGWATGVLAMSLPLGVVLGQGGSPLFVKKREDVPMMNWIWLAPAVITQILVSISVNRSIPPSPPSLSSKLSLQAEKKKTFKEYLTTMKSVFMNKGFMILFIVIGGAVGFFNAFSTQLSQLMCSRGYDNVKSGIAGSLVLGTGFLGAIISGLLVEKFGYIDIVAKVFFAISSVFGVILGQFLQRSNSEVWILLFCALFGTFGFGMYPLGLELSVEVTYPTDESIGTALIFLSGQIQGAVLVIISSLMETDLTKEEAEIAVCRKSITPKNHTGFLYMLSGFLILLTLIFIFFFHTKFKRSSADVKKTEELCPTPSTELKNSALT